MNELMRNFWIRHIRLGAVLFCILSTVSSVAAQKGKDRQKIELNDYFRVFNVSHGLSDNQILQMMQLPDGRFAIRTQKGVDIYDGRGFSFVALPADKASKLRGYNGQTHLYADSQDRLWVKDYQQVCCVDLRVAKVLEQPLDSVEDLFVDSRRNLWVVRGDSVVNGSYGSCLRLNRSWGSLQDLDTDGKYVYTFHESGVAAAFKDGNLIYVASAYSPAESLRYRSTSLTVQTPSGQFYQIRTGYDKTNKTAASVFLHFDPVSRKFTKIFACPYILHTLNMSSDSQALISNQNGYLMFDFRVSDTPREVRELSLPDGRSLTTGINTVCRDREGGIWLGTYNVGLIYVSPMLGLFFTIDKPWWQTERGILYVVLAVVVVSVASGLYLKRRQRKDVTDDCSINRCQQVEQESVQDKEPTDVEEPELVQKVRALMELHMEDGGYGVEQLANDLCMERTGLYKKLTTLTGTTPVSFMRSIRLQKSVALLQEGTLTINDIAERTGFGSPSYFTKCFKKEYGVLPSEYK